MRDFLNIKTDTNSSWMVYYHPFKFNNWYQNVLRCFVVVGAHKLKAEFIRLEGFAVKDFEYEFDMTQRTSLAK